MHTIRFSLDGEEVTTTHHQMTPNQIIRELGQKDPTTNYLVELRGNHKESYQDRGEELIRLHNNQRFIIVSTGATPVSDIARVGRGAFIAGLRDLGYEVELLDADGARVAFDYIVETGRHASRQVRIGLEVPADFPATVPGGPHVNPMIHGGTSVGSTHPTSNINPSPNFGPAWEYWSRPFPNWQAESRKTVATYMAHIWRLWDSQ